MADIEFDYATIDVKQELVDILKAQLPKKGFRDVRVLKSDPALPSELPCIGINRISDDETQMSIGDSIGASYDGTGEFRHQQGTFFNESMEVRIWHTNADQRDALYLTLRAILFAFRLPLVEKGLRNVTLRMGRDEQDSTMQFAPSVIYWSTITLTYANPLNVDIIEDVEPISAVIDNGTVEGG